MDPLFLTSEASQSDWHSGLDALENLRMSHHRDAEQRRRTMQGENSMRISSERDYSRKLLELSFSKPRVWRELKQRELALRQREEEGEDRKQRDNVESGSEERELEKSSDVKETPNTPQN